MKKSLIAMLVIAVFASACAAPATPTAAPTKASVATSAPAAPTVAPTKAPVATSAPAATAAPTTAPSASSAAEFYKGKTITLYTSGTAGSGSDLWARTIAKYLAEVTGAKVVVQNEPAGNGKVLFNQLAGGQIKADGLAICYTPVGTMWPGYMTSDSAVQYDITKFIYIGGAESGNYFLTVAPNSAIKSVDDLKKAKGLKFAHSAKNSTITMANALAIELLGLDGKIILGFDGATGRQLAVQQGDADATVMAPDTAMINITKKVASPILTIGMVRTKPGEDLPVLMELVKQDSLSDTQKRLITTIDILADSKSVFAPPGTPQDRVDFLVNAFKKAYAMPELRADLEKTIGATIGDYVSGDELAKRAANLASKKGDMKLWGDLLDKHVK